MANNLSYSGNTNDLLHKIIEYRPIKKDVDELSQMGSKRSGEFFYSPAEMKDGGDVGYYVTHEFLPNSAETTRHRIWSQPQETSTQNNEKDDRLYGGYGKLYQKYNEAISGIKFKIKQSYRDSIEKIFKKLRSIYQGDMGSTVKKEIYNPFKKLDLTQKVEKFSKYLGSWMRRYSILKRPEYSIRTPVRYDRKHEVGGLELLLSFR